MIVEPHVLCTPQYDKQQSSHTIPPFKHDALGPNVNVQVGTFPLAAIFVHVCRHNPSLPLPRYVELHLDVLLARTVFVQSVRNVVACFAIALTLPSKS